MQCPGCRAWNPNSISAEDDSVTLDRVSTTAKDRIKSGPWDYCWGGGIVRTSQTLFGGIPGAGKSTLLLQILDAICSVLNREVLYISAEEALGDIKARADRLHLKHQRLVRMFDAMGGVGDLAEVLAACKPSAIVVDSLQGIAGDDHPAAIRALATLKKVAAISHSPTIVISQVTKAGDYSGLNAYQHMVDTTMMFSVDEDDAERQLLVRKNRNGPAYISQWYEMTAEGLVWIDREDPGEDNDNEET